MTDAPAMPANVATAFAAFPPAMRERLSDIRALIFATAEATPGVGKLTETLRWGEPAYLTQASRSGSTIRLGITKASTPDCAVFVNCKTTLVQECRPAFSDVLSFEGDRAVLIDAARPLPRAALSQVFALALTYHRRKRPPRPGPSIRTRS